MAAKDVDISSMTSSVYKYSIMQWHLGEDTNSSKQALMHVLPKGPDVIAVLESEGMMAPSQFPVALYRGGLISGKNLMAFCNDRSEAEKLNGEVPDNGNKPKQAEPFNDFYQGANTGGGLQGDKRAVNGDQITEK
jgi:hypothetical protein